MDVLKIHVIEENVEIFPMDTIVFARADTQEETVIKVKNLSCRVNFKV